MLNSGIFSGRDLCNCGEGEHCGVLRVDWIFRSLINTKSQGEGLLLGPTLEFNTEPAKFGTECLESRPCLDLLSRPAYLKLWFAKTLGIREGFLFSAFLFIYQEPEHCLGRKIRGKLRKTNAISLVCIKNPLEQNREGQTKISLYSGFPSYKI